MVSVMGPNLPKKTNRSLVVDPICSQILKICLIINLTPKSNHSHEVVRLTISPI
jgi:hypothetical protein